MVAIAGITLVDLCRAVAQEIGPYQLLTLTTTAGSGTQVISTSAIDTEAPTSRYAGAYLYSHGPSVIREQQRVTREGFVGATGTFTVAKSFSVAPAAATTMSLLGTMPWIDQDGLTGLRTCVNRMSRKLWIRYRIPITSTGAEIISYDLGAYGWASRERFLRLYDPDPGSSGHSVPSSVRWRTVRNGEVWTLELGAGFPTGDVFYLEVEAPANSRLYLSGAWAQQSSPVANMGLDDDACLGEWNTLLQCTLFEVFRQLSVQAGGARKSYWEKRLNGGDGEPGQRAIVGAIKAYRMDADPWTPNSEQDAAPGSWNSVVGDKGFFSRW